MKLINTFKSYAQALKESAHCLMSNVKAKAIAVAAGIGIVSATATNSDAALSADATAIFTAVDTAGISTAVSGILVAFIGVSLLFLAYKYARKSISKG